LQLVCFVLTLFFFAFFLVLFCSLSRSFHFPCLCFALHLSGGIQFGTPTIWKNTQFGNTIWKHNLTNHPVFLVLSGKDCTICRKRKGKDNKTRTIFEFNKNKPSHTGQLRIGKQTVVAPTKHTRHLTDLHCCCCSCCSILCCSILCCRINN
jgi:hypothetical protein